MALEILIDNLRQCWREHLTKDDLLATHLARLWRRRMTGKVKNVNVEKRYGFITGDDGHDYFFHHSALKNCDLTDIERGREVTFEDAEGAKGLRAEDVYV